MKKRLIAGKKAVIGPHAQYDSSIVYLVSLTGTNWLVRDYSGNEFTVPAKELYAF